MEAQQTIERVLRRTFFDEDETHEAAIRIARERDERDRHLREVARQSRANVTHEVHTSIGG
jgi:hypothetical protein